MILSYLRRWLQKQQPSRPAVKRCNQIALESLEDRLALNAAPALGELPTYGDLVSGNAVSILEFTPWQSSVEYANQLTAGVATELKIGSNGETSLERTLHIWGSEGGDAISLGLANGRVGVNGFDSSVLAAELTGIVIHAGAGDDWVTVDEALDLNGNVLLVDLGAGDDYYLGSKSAGSVEWVFGGDGRDYLYTNGGSTADRLDGGADADSLYAYAHQVRPEGGEGNDSFTITDPWRNVSAAPGMTAGVTTSFFEYVSDGSRGFTRNSIYVYGTDGPDQVVFRNANGQVTLDGFEGALAAELLSGMSIHTAGGNDVVRLDSEANAGQDLFDTNYMPARVSLGDGDDVFVGSSGPHSMDWVYGGPGNDRLWSKGGDYDKLFGEGGDDELHAGAFESWLFGGDGNDRLVGTDGPLQDRIENGYNAGAGYELLFGGQGSDNVLLGARSYVFESRGVDAFFGVEDGHFLLPAELELIPPEERERMGLPEDLDGVHNPRVWRRAQPESETPEEETPEEETRRLPPLLYPYRIAQSDWHLPQETQPPAPEPPPPEPEKTTTQETETAVLGIEPLKGTVEEIVQPDTQTTTPSPTNTGSGSGDGQFSPPEQFNGPAGTDHNIPPTLPPTPQPTSDGDGGDAGDALPQGGAPLRLPRPVPVAQPGNIVGPDGHRSFGEELARLVNLVPDTVNLGIDFGYQAGRLFALPEAQRNKVLSAFANNYQQGLLGIGSDPATALNSWLGLFSEAMNQGAQIGGAAAFFSALRLPRQTSAAEGTFPNLAKGGSGGTGLPSPTTAGTPGTQLTGNLAQELRARILKAIEVENLDPRLAEEVADELIGNPVARASIQRVLDQNTLWNTIKSFLSGGRLGGPVRVVLTAGVDAPKGYLGEVLKQHGFTRTVAIYVDRLLAEENPAFKGPGREIQNIVDTIVHETTHLQRESAVNSLLEEYFAAVRQRLYQNSVNDGVGIQKLSQEARVEIWKDVLERYYPMYLKNGLDVAPAPAVGPSSLLGKVLLDLQVKLGIAPAPIEGVPLNIRPLGIESGKSGLPGNR